MLCEHASFFKHIAQIIASFPVVEKVILFGSQASGEVDEESDIDLLIVVRETPSKLKEYFEIRRALESVEMPFDIIILTKEEFVFYKTNWPNSVVFEAAQKGVLLYERQKGARSAF